MRLAGVEIAMRQSAAARGVLTDGEAKSTDDDADGSADGGATPVATELSEEQKHLARTVGIGAVKYADLSMNRSLSRKVMM